MSSMLCGMVGHSDVWIRSSRLHEIQYALPPADRVRSCSPSNHLQTKRAGPVTRSLI